MIEINEIRKSYNGQAALDGFDLSVEKGELFGLVGPNGAGKTTLIKILSTLLQPKSGTARIAGIEVREDPQAVKSMVGYMPDQPGLYQDMRLWEFLQFFADAFHLPKTQQHEAIERALARAGLAERRESFVEELSFGMKQRLFLAKTLLHSPQLLLLDEPATGLDPIARLELRRELRNLNAEGVTILISSHILSDLEDICTRVAFISKGRNVADEHGQKVIQLAQPASAVHVYEIAIVGPADEAAKAAAAAGGRVVRSQADRLLVEVPGGNAEVAGFLRKLIAAGVEVASFARSSNSLEERYQQAFGGRAQ